MYKWFRHFGKDKVLMNMTIFTIAFNISKLFNKQLFLLFSQIYRSYKDVISQNKAPKINIEQKQPRIE